MKITKTIKLSAVAVMALGNIVFAGGDISPVTAHELSDELKSAQIIPEPVKEVVIPPIAPKIVEEVKEDSPWYAGAGLVAGQAKASDCEDKTYGIMAKIGYDFSEYLGVEARGFQTNWDYEGGKLKHLGAFLKPMYPINEEITLYGLAGYAKTSMGTKRSFSDTGLAYGVGIDYALNEDFGLFVDYERLLHDAGVYDLDALSFGVSYGF